METGAAGYADDCNPHHGVCRKGPTVTEQERIQQIVDQAVAQGMIVRGGTPDDPWFFASPGVFAAILTDGAALLPSGRPVRAIFGTDNKG